MTQAEALALSAGQNVTYQPDPNGTPVLSVVLSNGPRRDAKGDPLPFSNNVLVVQLENGPMTVTWEPKDYPNGIPELQNVR